MTTPGAATMGPGGSDLGGDYSQIFEWVSQLLKGPEGREKALLELSRKREQYDDLALILWHSFGIFHQLLFLWNVLLKISCGRSNVNIASGNH